MDFLQSLVAEPEQVNVIGCSAGSLGAVLNAPFVFNRYPNANAYRVFGDSEVGIVTAKQWDGAWESWHLTLAPFIPALAPTYTRQWTNSIAGTVLSAQANYYGPKSTFIMYSSDYDLVQTTFYDLGGGGGDWSTLMRSELNQMIGNTTNTGYYIASGGNHCVDEKDGFFDLVTNGVYLHQWVSDAFAGNSFSRTVDCAPNCL